MAEFRSEDRVPTGVPGLDTLLGGGLVAGGVYLIMGRPGVGKTTLGNQACFTHVAGGGKAVYVTLLAETHARMLRNLNGMAFFDAEAIGPATHSVRSSFTRIAIAGPNCCFSVNPRPAV